MATDDLPTIGTTRYGDYEFNSTTLTTGFQVKPVRSGSDRTVAASKVVITLQTTESGNRISPRVRRAIATLQKDGLPFSYRNRPFGDWDVNTPGGMKDVAFGPKVGDLVVKPNGARRTVQLTWTVELTLPLCDDAAFAFAIMEFDFGVAITTFPNGDSEREISGYLKIPNNRLKTDGRLIRESADSYFEDIAPPLMPGFRREVRKRTISPDKSRLDFSFTDTQMPPNTPPPGVVLCSASHEYSGQSLSEWVGTLEAEYELLRGQGVFAAVVPFMGLLDERLDQVRAVRAGSGLPGGALGAGSTPIPLKMGIAEPTIYGPGNQKVRMSVSYQWAGVGLPAVIAGGGLWRPVAGSNWALWSASVATALGPRGTATIRVNANEDAIVDLCGKVAPVVPVAPPPRGV